MAVLVTAILKKMYREKTGRKEWALVSRKNPKKVLKWFGPKKPSKQEVLKEERRVQFFKHVKGAVVDQEILERIPRTAKGKPKKPSPQTPPLGVEKNTPQASLWQEVLKSIPKPPGSLEEQWIAYIATYRQLAQERGLVPFSELSSQDGSQWIILESKAKKAADLAASTLIPLGCALNKIRLARVVSIPCPGYKFYNQMCLAFVFSCPKANLDLASVEKKLGFHPLKAEEATQDLEKLERGVVRAWKSDKMYLLEMLRRLVLVVLSPLPGQAPSDLSRLKQVAKNELQKYEGGK